MAWIRRMGFLWLFVHPVSPVAAQDQVELSVGASVRMTTVSPDSAPAWIRGELTAIDSSTGILHLRVPDVPAFTVPAATLTRLQVRTGTKTAGAVGLGMGALMGGLVGGAWGAAAHTGNPSGDFTQRETAMMGAGLGILVAGSIGGLVGLFIPVPVWSDVPLPLALSPAPSGR